MIRNRLFQGTVLILALLGTENRASAQLGGIGTEFLPLQLTLSTDDPFHSSRQVKPVDDKPFRVFRGQTVRVTITGEPKKGYHTYPLVHRTPEQPTNLAAFLTYFLPSGIVPIGPYQETKPSSGQFPDGKSTIPVFEFEHQFTWEHDLLILPNAEPGIYTFLVEVKTQVCNDKGCNPVFQLLKATIEVVPEPVGEMSAELVRRKDKKPFSRVATKPLKPTATPSNGGKDQVVPPPIKIGMSESGISLSEEAYREYYKQLASLIVIKKKTADDEKAESGLLFFMLLGVAWGAISLITPCVFPMIPITVSFFLKQSEKEHHKPITMAAIYSGTIILVLTLAAALFINFFQALIIHPLMNFAIGALFIYFALSLLGMYEIELPSGLARFTSAHEGKGGYVGVIFMALTFTIISFACVAPFLGGFAGTAAANRPIVHTLLGGLAFASTFAAPFFILALFPTMLKKMPKSGSWLNTVKVVMGFLELAAALKFLRSGEILSTAMPSIFTFDLSLGLYVALAILCALYLLNVYRLPHDSPVEHLSVPRLLFGFAFLGLALHLLPALFKYNAEGESQRPRGTIYAWVESFLLPEQRSGEGKTGNLEYAIQKAREYQKKTGERKRIFLDCTGVVCSNCRLNENNVFTQPEIKKLFEPYLFVSFYTDIVPAELYAPGVRANFRDQSRQDADGLTNLMFQTKVFGTSERPFYVVLEPHSDDDKIDAYVYGGGVINNVNEFAEFLRKPEGNPVQAQAQN